MYKTLPTDRRALPLQADSSIFVASWKQCILDKKSDLTEVLEMMEPVFIRWEELLTLRDLREDINFLTLCRMLDPDPEIALAKVKKWTEWAETSSSIKDELIFIFIERVRKLRYPPASASNKMVEYIVAKDFKRGIHHHIRAITRLKSRDALFYSETFDENEFEKYITYPDYFVLNMLRSNKWNSYLFHLISEGYTIGQRSELTKLHRRNLYKEEKKLCRLAKQKP
jgi:hypothetical protein